MTVTFDEVKWYGSRVPFRLMFEIRARRPSFQPSPQYNSYRGSCSFSNTFRPELGVRWWCTETLKYHSHLN